MFCVESPPLLSLSTVPVPVPPKKSTTKTNNFMHIPVVGISYSPPSLSVPVSPVPPSCFCFGVSTDETLAPDNGVVTLVPTPGQTGDVIDVCSNGVPGIESDDGEACCVAGCVTCGGDGCESAGGLTAEECCSEDILSSGELCEATGMAPCIIISGERQNRPTNSSMVEKNLPPPPPPQKKNKKKVLGINFVWFTKIFGEIPPSPLPPPTFLSLFYRHPKFLITAYLPKGMTYF